LLRAFELRLLLASGYLPDLSAHALPTGEPNLDACLTQEARAASIKLIQAPLESLPHIDMDTLRAVARIFLYRLKQMKQAPLKSVMFLKDLGV